MADKPKNVGGRPKSNPVAETLFGIPHSELSNSQKSQLEVIRQRCRRVGVPFTPANALKWRERDLMLEPRLKNVPQAIFGKAFKEFTREERAQYSYYCYYLRLQGKNLTVENVKSVLHVYARVVKASR